jgi:hypothetical protein
VRTGNNYSGARWAHSRRPSRAADPRLVPIVKTRMAPRLTHGGAGRTAHRECWAAKTTDGVWGFEREDSAGTPWLVYHLPSVKDGSLTMPLHLTSTLKRCQLFVGTGDAAATLAMMKCPHDRDSTTFRLDRRSGLHWQDCHGCGASQVWHIDCPSCENLTGHGWTAGRVTARPSQAVAA